jgi:hypothetical protein
VNSATNSWSRASSPFTAAKDKAEAGIEVRQ